MDAAVLSFHLSLSPTSFSSLTRFRPVAMPYNDKPALFKSFSIFSIHRCFGRPTGLFTVVLQLWTMDSRPSLFILAIWPGYCSISTCRSPFTNYSIAEFSFSFQSLLSCQRVNAMITPGCAVAGLEPELKYLNYLAAFTRFVNASINSMINNSKK